MKFSKIIVAVMLLFLAAFTVAMSICAFVVQYEPSTLIGCVFAFAGVEGGALAMIKIFEKDGKNNDRFNNNSSSSNRADCRDSFGGGDSLDQEQDHRGAKRAD